MHLAAIVGDPACARDPELSHEVNVDGSRALVADAERLGVRRFVFASTCSNYGRMADPTTPIDRGRRAAPPCRSTPSRRCRWSSCCSTASSGDAQPTCLRFATVYGVAPRMRFDLTVNEFTRDLWADRELEVFGEQFWRPYVHVRDAAAAIRTVLDAPLETGRRRGLQRRPLGRELPQARSRRGDPQAHHRARCSYVQRDEDPRDYKVSFDKIRNRLGFETEMTVPDGIAELMRASTRRLGSATRIDTRAFRN